MPPSAPKKRLLIVFDVAFPFVKGGAQRRFYEIARRLADRGWAVDWLTFKSWSGPDAIEQDGIRYISLGPLPSLYNKHGRRSKLEPILFLLRFLLKLPGLGGYDAYWLGQWPLLHLAPAIPWLRLHGKIVLVDWWEYWEKRVWISYSRSIGFFGFLAQQATAWIAGRWATIFTDSTLEQRRLRSFLGPDARITFASNGVSRSEIGEVDPDRRPDYDVVYFGRLKDHKRVDVLLQALRSMADRRGQAPRAAIIGDGPERAALETLARQLKIEDRVRFFGKILDSREMYDLIKRGAVCAVTTMGGGGGNLSILEANACGLPVVAFQCEDGIDTELIEEGRNGVLVPSATHEELGLKIDLLLGQPEKLLEMKRQALNRSREFDWARIADIYERALSAGLSAGDKTR